jgi:hypothetical protein
MSSTYTGTRARLTLPSFVWPDQTERFQQLSNAIEIARTVPATVQRADTVEWLESQLANSRQCLATVMFHSIVLLYLSHQQRERVTQMMTAAGERASMEAPLAWLSMEPGESEADVHLTLWPGSRRKRIAKAGYHGRNAALWCGLEKPAR